MLYELTIENFVLIEKERLVFKDGLNIITGETGAGKSIIFSAIRVLLGQKSAKELVGRHGEYARVEGVFYNKDAALSQLLIENGFEDEDGQLIITREFNDKRSVMKINGRTCLNSFIKEVGGYLIDFHGQRDNAIILDSKSHLQIIDAYGCELVKDDLDQIKEIVGQYHEVLDEIRSYETGNDTVERELDLLAYQIQEIDDAQLKAGEDVEIEERLALLRNSETIHHNLSEVYEMFHEAGGLSDLSDKILQDLSDISTYDDDLKKIYDLAQEMVSLSDDINNSARRYLDNFDRDEEELYYLETRYDLINTLKMKYGQSVDIILAFCADLKEKQERLLHATERLETLRAKKAVLEADYYAVAEVLREKRRGLAVDLAAKITAELEHLNLKGAVITFDFEQSTLISVDGADRVEIQIITNPGEDFRSIKKIASGGEISRVMLAIKSVLENDRTEKTLIYDEIDTGISGETAEIVGERLFQLAKNNQIISVTHLPQIAVFADHHLIIEKETEADKARTRVLHGEGTHIKRELGRLVAGKTISVNTLKHVEEMMSNAFKRKL